MASTSCEVIWIISLLKDFGVEELTQVRLYYDSKAANYVSTNPICKIKSA